MLSLLQFMAQTFAYIKVLRSTSTYTNSMVVMWEGHEYKVTVEAV